MTTETISVHILDKDYQVACPSDERNALNRAANDLDRRMREIRQSGTVIGVERIAVMAALNLAYELMNSSGQSSDLDQTLVEDMLQRIDAAISH